jgi:hypothetical protein
VTVTATSGSLSRSVSILVTVQPSSSVGGTLLNTNALEVLAPYAGVALVGLAVSLGAVLSMQVRRNRPNRLEMPH